MIAAGFACNPSVGPLLRDKLSVPTKDRVGGDERRNIFECSSANGLAANRESAALIVGQSKSFVPELLLEGLVFLSEILDDRILLAADPASHGGDEDLPGL
jgi:hypothetical protein